MTTLLGYAALVNGRAPQNITADGLATTLNGATLVGAGTATLTSAVGFTVGTIVVLEAGTANAELALIIAIAGAVVTFSDGGLVYAHASGAAVARAIIPWAPAETVSSVMPRSPYLAGG